jgi:hypothetical protein
VTAGLELRGNFSQGASHWWRRLADAIVPEHCDLQALGQRDRTPWDLNAFWVFPPWFSVYHGLGEELEVFHRLGHRSVNTANGFLTGHAAAGVEVREAAVRGTDGEDAGHSCWDSQ